MPLQPTRLLTWLLLAAPLTFSTGCDLDGLDHHLGKRWLHRILESLEAARDFESYEWTEINGDAEWAARAGLQVVEIDGRFYLMGGRTPNPPSFPPIPGDSQIWGDVWVSDDHGVSWQRILETDDSSHWPARAYFQALTLDDTMVVLGGQNFDVLSIPCPPFLPQDQCPPPFVSDSDFFNDVWSSVDGVNWTRETADAGWEPRAGLMAIEHEGDLYVMGGSQNDDSAVIGGPPLRIYFDDVWKSSDGGASWVEVNADAPWEARAGGVLVSKGGWIYLIGGEEGFLCEPQPCELPYFNDVWATQHGVEWHEVTPAADWIARPGHQCVVVAHEIVCFGGFGLPQNPMDVWVSSDGAHWTQVSDSPWNAVDPSEVKYDFDALVVRDGPLGLRPRIFTFGGDRETFDFTDPTNYLNVDNDVWDYSPPRSGWGWDRRRKRR